MRFNTIEAKADGFELTDRIQPIYFPIEFECKSCYWITENRNCDKFEYCHKSASVISEVITIEWFKWKSNATK